MFVYVYRSIEKYLKKRMRLYGVGDLMDITTVRVKRETLEGLKVIRAVSNRSYDELITGWMCVDLDRARKVLVERLQSTGGI
jgi:hypothetical protein